MRVESIKTNDIQYSSQRLSTGENRQNELPGNREIESKEVMPQKKYTEEELKSAITSVNKAINPYDRKLEFSIHEATRLISVKVIDTNTDEVIREIPPEKILDMVAKLWEIAGIIVDQKI
ncbi:flagellar protein FlaG [Proteiniborus sp. MB09-C3]|uniref:flagellar protein FlaG n=1 Tax=Proteiniborus sp. MB09-C3 TaxID=3050072 RepID=UPI0025569EFC|nr:flagellar protein FlaG [Proteiniborus sp. MB09-C3]WIV12019.1 flagellar protein FlaG [Proteiniborus sp. MB09-C3]